MAKHENILLGVNIDHIATVRQARGTRYPDPVAAAALAEQAGADGITLHLREDRRHIQDRDVRILKEVLLTHMNLEMAITEEMVNIALEIKPEHCCLVPERREELTTEGGLDVRGQLDVVKAACDKLAGAGVQASLFIDPDLQQIKAAKASGAPVIELHTGCYADAESDSMRAKELQRIIDATKFAHHDCGLQVNAGHGLNYQNVQAIAAIPEIVELNIGHALIAHACFVGLPEAVQTMKQLMLQGRLQHFMK